MRRHRAWPAMASALTCVGVLALTGCVGIPTSGPVEEGEVVLPEQDDAIPIPTGPREDATPEEIVKGFLAASAAGVYDDYQTAREFLSGGARTDWDPWASTTVYGTADPVVRVDEPDAVALVTVEPVATVDDAGRYTESATGTDVLPLSFSLAQSAGEWRISELPDGVLMSYTSLESSHREVGVYFASLDGQVLVPEMRWFQRSKIVEQATRALIEGPSPWLRDGVRTGVPAGVSPPLAGITIDGANVLTLNLTSDIAGTPSVEDRDLLQEQLTATLAGTQKVISGITVTLNGRPWAPTSDVPQLEVNPTPTSGPFVLVDDADGVSTLTEVLNGKLVPVADAAPLTGLRAESPAVSLDGSIRVVLDGRRRLMLIPPDSGEPTPLVEGTALLPPSVDRYGWTWTAEELPATGLTAVSASGEVLDVAADWLAGREVRSLRVSRDGVRVAVAYQSPEGPSVIEVAAIVRDGDGRPQSLGAERQVVGASLVAVDEISWLDEGTLAVLGMGAGVEAPTAYEVPLGGRTSSKPLQPGAVDIAATPERIYLADVDGVLRRSQASTWTPVVTGVRDPAFPG